MALVTDKSVFLHIPKCGGMWIRHVFKLCKIKHQEIGDQHIHFPELLQHRPEGFFNDKFVFAFVRHPLTWYQSRWAFRVKLGWKGEHPLDFNCASNDFHTFVNNVIMYKPSGWLTLECQSYIDTCFKPIDFVGRTENLVDDMITALTMAGERFDVRDVKRCPRINDSDMDGKSSKYWAMYDERLAKRLLAVESEVINRYYYNHKIDVQSLCGSRPY